MPTSTRKKALLTSKGIYDIILRGFNHACVAQLAEQLTRNEQVAGSNPATSSKRTPSFGMVSFFACGSIKYEGGIPSPLVLPPCRLGGFLLCKYPSVLSSKKNTTPWVVSFFVLRGMFVLFFHQRKKSTKRNAA